MLLSRQNFKEYSIELDRSNSDFQLDVPMKISPKLKNAFHFPTVRGTSGWTTDRTILRILFWKSWKKGWRTWNLKRSEGLPSCHFISVLMQAGRVPRAGPFHQLLGDSRRPPIRAAEEFARRLSRTSLAPDNLVSSTVATWDYLPTKFLRVVERFIASQQSLSGAAGSWAFWSSYSS